MLVAGDILLCLTSFFILPWIFIWLYKQGKKVYDVFPAWQRLQVEEALKNMVGDGVKLMSSNGVPLIGVGKGVQLLDESPNTTMYLGCLAVAGFVSFYHARIAGEGFVFGGFVYLATSTQLAIMAICSFHTTYDELTLVFCSFIYALVMIGWRLVYYWLWNIDTEQRIEPRNKHETKLETLAKDGVAVTVAFGLGLGLGLLGGDWGNDIWISRLNACAFWFLFGGQLLDRGIWYELSVYAGTVCTMSMVISAAMTVLMPGYNPTVLVFSSLAVFLHLEWYLVEVFVVFIWKRGNGVWERVTAKEELKDFSILFLLSS